MNPDKLNLTPAQLIVYESLTKIRMAWVALVVLFVLFAGGFICFLFAIFRVPQQDVAKGSVGGIDGVLVWGLKIVLTNLFPPPK
jgi:hypothetical protein